jgi:hypothetical protein
MLRRLIDAGNTILARYNVTTSVSFHDAREWMETTSTYLTAHCDMTYATRFASAYAPSLSESPHTNVPSANLLTQSEIRVRIACLQDLLDEIRRQK